MTTEDAIALIYDLKRDRSGGHERPHKPILLLSILDLIENGTITENRGIKSVSPIFHVFLKGGIISGQHRISFGAEG